MNADSYKWDPLQRPRLTYRTDYETFQYRERFIVSLLKIQITALIEQASKQAGTEKKALDIGCGGQPFRKQTESAGYCYKSLDTRQNESGAVDYIGTIDQPLPKELIQEGPFDLILCTEVLEHVVHWDVAFQNFSHLLKKGGRIILSAPFFFPLHEEPYDFWRPTIHCFQYFGTRHGLKPISIEKAGDAWSVLGTFLGFSEVLPRNHQWSSRIKARVLDWIRNKMFDLLSSETFSKHIELKIPLYLANIICFQKD